MGILLKTAIRFKGRMIQRSFDRVTEDPQTAQTQLLLDILRRNEKTRYGQDHGFSQIVNAGTFAQRVPTITFSELAPYVERIRNGETNVLTAAAPFMFNVTSGTTAKPKYLPITRDGMALTANASHHWLYRALQDHPGFLDHSFLCISGASIEGRTRCGIPYGSASGAMYQSLPRVLHGSFALPFVLPDITHYDIRYYVTAQMALASEPSVLITPNPLTLIRVAETGIRYQEAIIRSIHDGTIDVSLPFEKNTEDSRILDAISARLRPNPQRAQFLERVVHQHGELVPSACWKKLRLIGCWLGGSIGFQADRLAAWFGQDIPQRDIGYLASEGSITIPSEDNTPAGVLALHNAYYEFTLADRCPTPDAPVLQCHELEDGKQYRVILTNWNGLYRYDIDDIIEVRGFYNKTPVIAFVRKGDDVVNIAGEKLHVNHFIETFRRLQDEHQLSVEQFRVVPDDEELRHQILLRLDSEVSCAYLRDTVIPLIDKYLSEANIEYDGRRKSKRLNPPLVHVMDETWADEVRKRFVASGHRDIQYKWRMIATEISDLDRRHIRLTVTT